MNRQKRQYDYIIGIMGDVLGSTEKAEAWMRLPNITFKGRKPIDLITLTDYDKLKVYANRLHYSMDVHLFV